MKVLAFAISFLAATLILILLVVRKLASFYDVNYGVRSVANEVQRIAMHLVADAHINGQLLDEYVLPVCVSYRVPRLTLCIVAGRPS